MASTAVPWFTQHRTRTDCMLPVSWSQAERHALRQDMARAQTQLLQAQASSRAAEAAANINQEEKAAMAEALLAAR